MKAITLTQPWAEFVAAGAKQWETRSWTGGGERVSDIVLDLETFGVGPDSAVVSIGAVCLDTGDEFYRVIKEPSGNVEVGSVRWWLSQHEHVRAEATNEGAGIEWAILTDFDAFLRKARGDGTIRLWGSEDFDTVILGRAYDRCNIKRPWHYQEPRGLRTVLDLAGVDEDAIPWAGTEHIAIDCARHAATALRQALDRFKPAAAAVGVQEEGAGVTNELGPIGPILGSEACKHETVTYYSGYEGMYAVCHACGWHFWDAVP